MYIVYIIYTYNLKFIQRFTPLKYVLFPNECHENHQVEHQVVTTFISGSGEEGDAYLHPQTLGERLAGRQEQESVSCRVGRTVADDRCYRCCVFWGVFSELENDCREV